MTRDLKPYSAYKDSGVPWVGHIPAHWAMLRGKALFSESQLPVRDSDEIVTCFRDGQVTLRRNRRASGFMVALKEAGYQGVRKGQLVIHAMDAFAGAVGVSESDGKCTPEYIVCDPRRAEAEPGYFAYVLRVAAQSKFIEIAYPAVRERAPRLRYPAFGTLQLPVPTAREQVGIFRYLTYANLRIQRYIRAKKKLIALLNEQKQAIIHRAVTRGLDPGVRLKPSGVEWLGEVPAHWTLASLRRVTIARCDGPFGSGLKSSHYTVEGVRVVRLQNIGHAEFNDSDRAFIAPSHYESLGDHSIQENDLLIAGLGDNRHPAGRACVAPKTILPAMVKADCFRFRIDQERLNSEFASLHLTATAPEASAILSTGATRQRINLQATESRGIYIPPLSEQLTIVSHIREETRVLRIAAETAGREIRLLEEYRTRLIADVVTGKLDVREAAARLPEEIEDLEPLNEGEVMAEDEEGEGAEGDDSSEEAVA
jgi:type I restriction enzyme S subunit